MKLVTTALMEELSRQAATSPRGRTNFNLHPQLDDPVQRFLNVIEPGSYVRPHRHTNPPRWELFVILAGVVVVLILDDAGRVVERVELDADGPVRAIEIPAGAWHTLAVRAPGTVLFEFKPGPYAAVDDKDFAAWAPREGDAACPGFIGRILAAQPGTPL
jgi:cupin fold WbuC family metalloprotein